MAAAITRTTVLTRAQHRRWRQFRVYWSGHLLSFTGDWFTILALPIVAATIDGRAIYVGIVAAAELIATPICGLWLGSVADRLDPRRTMWWSDVVRALLLSAVAAWISIANPPLWVLPAAAFVLSALRDLHDAAENVMVAAVVPVSLLVRANGRFQISDGAGHVVGAVLAGAVAARSPAGALGLDAISFLVAAGAVNLMGSFPVNRGAERPTAPWRATWRALRVEDRYWRVVVTVALANVTTACFLAPFILFARRELGLTATGIGITWAAMGLGGAAAGLALDRVRSLRPAWALAATGTLAVATGVTAVARSWAVTLAAFVVIGAVLALGMATIGSLRHASFPAEVQGRVAMASRVAFVLGVAPGTIVAAWLADLPSVGPARSYLLFALVSAIATGIGVALRVDRLPVPTPDHANRLVSQNPADAAFWGEGPTVDIDLRDLGGRFDDLVHDDAPDPVAIPDRHDAESRPSAPSADRGDTDTDTDTDTDDADAAPLAWADRDPFELIAHALREHPRNDPA